MPKEYGGVMPMAEMIGEMLRAVRSSDYTCQTVECNHSLISLIVFLMCVIL
jgi:hypothetical protein